LTPKKGSWGPKIFSPWGSTKSLLCCQISRPYVKSGVRGAWQLFSFFSIGHLVNRVLRGACTTVENFLYCILQRTKLSKKNFVRILNFAPVLVIWPPNLTHFWKKNLAQNFRAPALQGYRVRHSQVESLVAK